MLIKSLAFKGPRIGLYPSEIVSITMLGDGKPLRWEMKGEGLFVEMPKEKPCEHAFVLKIARKAPF